MGWNFWNGLFGSKTVSRWPINRSLGPGPACSATRCPARLNGVPSTHCVLKPSASNSCWKILPTARTPSKFCVPLLMLTTCSSVFNAASLLASMKATIFASSAVSAPRPPCPAGAPVNVPPATRQPTITADTSFMASLYSAHLAAQQRHRTEHRLAELSSVDTDCPLQVIGERLAVGGAAEHVGHPGQIRKADREVDRHHRLLAGPKRKPEREIDVRGARVFDVERSAQCSERETECIWIRDLRPQPNPGTAERIRRRRTVQSDLSPLVRCLFELRRLHERAQVLERGATRYGQRQQAHNDESWQHGTSSLRRILQDV